MFLSSRRRQTRCALVTGVQTCALPISYAMAGAAILSVTLVPVLMGWLIRGKIPAEQANPINRWLTHIYRPAIDWTLHRPKTVLVIAALVFATTAFPLSRLGGEFMPNMDEGDLLYMHSALPGLSAAKASALLQQTDRLIQTVPEARSVLGQAGRAEPAHKPAPLAHRQGHMEGTKGEGR